jgi:hydroxyacylglutathione hydrolase
MTLRFERIQTDGIAMLSYLVGDDSEGTAAVIDPRPDVDVYLEMARRSRVTITHIFETHIHADFMSGACELADRVGNARICASAEGGAEYGFDHTPVRDGERFRFGKVELTARHTPGHTPEHLSFEIGEAGGDEPPWAVFSGDSLFVGSAGRPDLLGKDEEKLSAQLFHTLRDYYLGLPDHTIVMPCHGAGSACGADIADRPVSTIGRERRHNPFLQIEDVDEFTEFVLGGAPPEPTHYKTLKKINAAGPPVIGHLPTVPGLTPEQFKEAVGREGTQLVDTRDMLAFGGAHIGGALNIGARQELSVWAGWMLDHERPILLILESDTDLEEVAALLLRTGFTRFAGRLVGGMRAWCSAGYPIRHLPQMSVHELEAQRDTVLPLDVRNPDEWEAGHVPGAHHLCLCDLAQNGKVPLDPGRPLAVYCGSGYRASIAASLLIRRGFRDVRNVPGSWGAWQSAGLPTEKPVGQEAVA